ncbi:MAG: sigma 54-interacting transcriptional regulator [Deltaproteobacteria bacterium]|nr:sigma 54-interacting transcriptional regulator [Deltaproteobacteria bacterium]
MTKTVRQGQGSIISKGAPTEAILESISDGVFTVDDGWRITSFNRAAEEITGVSRQEAIGRQCSEVFRASMCETGCALRQTKETGFPVINKSAFIIDAEGNRIPISVSTALLRDEEGFVFGGAETFRDLSLVEELRKELESRFRVSDMVSRSPLMRRIFDILPQVANSDSTVLIQGETGTGKELLARAIHNQSHRSRGPFVAVSCAALPDTLLESELFGYKAGAFTGANKDKPGRFALAEGGTLFLDEIGEISPALQVRLLRVLQEKTFDPLGSTRSVHSDIRVITATNRDLAGHVKKGGFRQDLFYRINVVRIDLPPLRKRKEDIPLLVEHFVARFNSKQDKAISSVSPEVIALLMAHEYSGNIRELENIIEHAFVLCSEGQIEMHHLPEDFITGTHPSPEQGGMNIAFRALESQMIRQALRRNHYNRAAAARELGMHKSTLFRKIKALGVSLPKRDGRSRSKN